jgi:hypothetical protein
MIDDVVVVPLFPPFRFTFHRAVRIRVDGQTNSVSFDTICLAVEHRSEPADCGRADDKQTNSVSFDTICLAVERCSETVDCGRADDGQTNSVSFDTICLAVERCSETADSTGCRASQIINGIDENI